jgi:hypothetical protein
MVVNKMFVSHADPRDQAKVKRVLFNGKDVTERVLEADDETGIIKLRYMENGKTCANPVTGDMFETFQGTVKIELNDKKFENKGHYHEVNQMTVNGVDASTFNKAEQTKDGDLKITE